MQKYIYLLMGNSGAGKDHLAGLMAGVNQDMVIRKMASPGKRLFEQIYNLPIGAMDDREKRLETIRGSVDTYLNRFIYWFHHQEQIFPHQYFLKQALANIQSTLGRPDVNAVIISDVRTPSEVHSIVDLVIEEDYRLIPVFIENPVSTPLSSDEHLMDNLDLLQSYSFRTTKVLEPLTVYNRHGADLAIVASKIVNLAR